MRVPAARRVIAFALALAVAALLAPGIAAGPHWRIAIAILLCLVAGWIANDDLARMTIPDGAVVALALVALMVAWMEGADLRGLAVNLLVAAAVGAVLFAAAELYGRLRGIDVLGFGDVKLLAASSLLVGPWGVAAQVALASVAALLFAMLRARRRGRRLRATSRLPFGAFLAPALVLVWAWMPFQP